MTSARFPARTFALFALLSAADFALTLHLLDRAGGAIYEANPVAGWWLARFGWPGLAAFKAAAVFATAVLVALVARRRVRVARGVMAFGCIAVGLVVTYSGALATIRARAPGMADWEPRAVGPGVVELQTADQLRRSRDYRELMDRLAGDLVAGRCDLGIAADRLANSEQARDPNWITKMDIYYPGLDRRGQLAASLVRFVVSQPTRYPEVRRAAPRLIDELRSMCGAVAEDIELDAAGAIGLPPDSRVTGV